MMSSLMNVNTLFWVGVILATIYLVRRAAGYASDHWASSAETVVIGLGDVYKMQSSLAKAAMQFYSVVGHKTWRRIANIHTSRVVLIQIITTRLNSKTKVKSQLLANHGFANPVKNGMAVTQGLGNDILSGIEVFQSEETKEVQKKKIARRIDGSGQLLLLASDQGATSGGAIGAGQIALLQQYASAPHVSMVLVESQKADPAQARNTEILSRHAKNFSSSDFILTVQQKQGLTDEENTNKSLAPLLAVLTATKSKGQDINDVVERLVKPSKTKLLVPLDLGELPVSTKGIDSAVLTRVTNDLEQDPDVFYERLFVTKSPETWRFRRVRKDEEARKAWLIVAKPTFASVAIFDEIRTEVEHKLGLQVVVKTVHDWRERFAHAYLVFPPINENEAKCIDLYNWNPSIFATPALRAKEVLSNEEAEKRRAREDVQTKPAEVAALE
ncbi:MAG: hypothetical protein ABSB56_00925 [Nitrososphaerales archaeon]|jgi:hypothetical protein